MAKRKYTRKKLSFWDKVAKGLEKFLSTAMPKK